MRKHMIMVVLLVSAFLTGCLDIQFGNSPKGDWALLVMRDVYQTADSLYVGNSVTYDPDIDKYYDGLIVRITNDQLISYSRGRNTAMQINASYDINMIEDTLFCYYGGSHLDSFFFAYYFEKKDQMILIEGDPETGASEYYFRKYSDGLPPESWENPISDDEYEPDNDIENATGIRLGNAQSHTITENDTDYVSFVATEGEAYLIKGLSYFEIETALLDQDGNVLDSDQDNDDHILDLGDAVETVILWECNETGTYYVRTAGESKTYSALTGYYQTLIETCNIDDIEYGEDVIIFEKKSFSGGRALGYSHNSQ